jgi:predicted ATPase
MRIDRLEVSGGFLDGLNVTFLEGLNVLIGARGAGKTSVLELIRFVLAIPAMTEEAEAEAGEQALAILGDGTVTLYVSVGGQPVVFTRTGFDEAPSASRPYESSMPLIVSQNEIEAIGLDPSSRREILDRLVEPAGPSARAPKSRNEVAAIERRLELLREEREGVVEQAERAKELEARLAEAEKEQKSGAANTEKLEKLQTQVAEMSDEVGQLRAAADSYGVAAEALADWREQIHEASAEPSLPELPSSAVDSQVAAKIAAAGEGLRKADAALEAAEKLVSRARKEKDTKRSRQQKKLKEMNDQLDKIETGAGELGRKVSALRQELKGAQAQQKRAAQLAKQIEKLMKQRETALDRLEAVSSNRFEHRKRCAEELTDRFNGRIEVRVDKSGELSSYEAALVELLQGSNLRYKTLAARLTPKVSPRELVAAVEAGDSKRLADLADIDDDRSRRLLAHLEGRSLSSLLMAPLDDAVDFALLDGQEYKVTRNLSMGQRCTVVLPLLLAEEHEAILLDQPEDHLDNAFIVDTLVSAIRNRSEGGQAIVATHNANIPVLGDARQVVVLASDGRRGFVASAADLDAAPSVEAITTLMEGGRKAFAKRAAFYTAHPDE